MPEISREYENKKLVFSIEHVVAYRRFFSAGWALFNPPRTRTILNLNKTWKFNKQDISGAQAVGYNDAAWASVNLPHSFEQPYWRTNMAQPPYVGWYRRHLTIDTSLILANKRIFIEFEAAFLVSDVYVNGVLVGTHKGGYTGFSYMISLKTFMQAIMSLQSG